MKHIAMGLVLGIVGAATIGCSGRTVESEVEQYIEQMGIDVEDCGDIDIESPCNGNGSMPAAASCFVDAFGQCKGARSRNRSERKIWWG